MPVFGRWHLHADGRRPAHFDDAGAQLAMVLCILSTSSTAFHDLAQRRPTPDTGAFVNPGHGWNDLLVRKHMYIKRTVRERNCLCCVDDIYISGYVFSFLFL